MALLIISYLILFFGHTMYKDREFLKEHHQQRYNSLHSSVKTSVRKIVNENEISTLNSTEDETIVDTICKLITKHFANSHRFDEGVTKELVRQETEKAATFGCHIVDVAFKAEIHSTYIKVKADIRISASKITKLMGNITVIDITKLKQEYDNYPISGNMVASIFTESMYLLNLIDEIDEVVDKKIIDDNLLIVETWMKNHEYYFRKNADLYLTPEQMHDRACVATALNVKISI